MDIIKDICITDIVSVYELNTLTWSRPKPLARHTNVLAFFIEGSVAYYFEDETIVGHAGDLLAFSKGLVYSGQKIADRNRYYGIEFDTDKPMELHRLGLGRITPAAKGVREQFLKLLEHWNNGDILLCKSALYDLLNILTSSSVEKETLKKAIALMKRRISDPDLSVSDLCAAVCISESQLRRLFHQELGRSPMQYLNELRMAQAKNMLMQGDVSIGEVAEFCGYSTLYYFSRDFKAKNGVSPTQYRQRYIP